MNDQQAPIPKRKWRKRTIVIVSILSIVFLGLAISTSFLFHQMQLAREALSAYDDALVAKDYVRAYGLGSSEFQKAISESDFAEQQILLVSHHGALKKIVLGPTETARNQHGLTSTIDSRFVFDRDEVLFTVTMKKEGERWLIYGYREQ